MSIANYSNILFVLLMLICVLLYTLKSDIKYSMIIM